jgi:hypothetical protein
MRPSLFVGLLLVVALSCVASVPCATASPVLYVSFHGGNDGVNNINSYSLTGDLVKSNVLNGDTSSGETTTTATTGTHERLMTCDHAEQWRAAQQRIGLRTCSELHAASGCDGVHVATSPRHAPPSLLLQRFDSIHAAEPVFVCSHSNTFPCSLCRCVIVDAQSCVLL